MGVYVAAPARTAGYVHSPATLITPSHGGVILAFENCATEKGKIYSNNVSSNGGATEFNTSRFIRSIRTRESSKRAAPSGRADEGSEDRRPLATAHGGRRTHVGGSEGGAGLVVMHQTVSAEDAFIKSHSNETAHDV
ncbi:unnamed protein product [Lampetra fluviatilis]